MVRLDACPELKEGWLSKIEQCLARESPPIKVERAAGGHHEGVGLVEQFNGQATRMADDGFMVWCTRKWDRSS